MIRKIVIQNYKSFREFELEFNDDINILVGDNECGKSTLLEAINLALSKRLNGRYIENELSAYIFNTVAVRAYLDSLTTAEQLPPPQIVIELYFDAVPELEDFRGSMNSKKEDVPGMKLVVSFDDDFQEDYQEIIANSTDVKTVPVEFYKVEWLSFSDNQIRPRKVPLNSAFIDASTIRLKNGTDYYLQNILNDNLSTKEKAALSMAYRKLKELFSENDEIISINEKLAESSDVSAFSKELSIAIDTSQKSNWDSNISPHLGDLPFDLSGNGQQNILKILLALDRQGEESKIILIEEPENHLSFSSMSRLINNIQTKCVDKQIFISTHSTYVLNKLGIDHLFMMHKGVPPSETTVFRMDGLKKSTKSYFEKLSGYDTLRLVLSKRAILVEGPSDELIVQKAYLQSNSKLPIDDGIDVINVRGLSFKRFLDIALLLNKQVTVVTDNDGDYQSNITQKYKNYSNPSIKICASKNDALVTLENQFLAINDLSLMIAEINPKSANASDLEKYMRNNKSEWALKIFKSEQNFSFPDYIEDAIK